MARARSKLARLALFSGAIVALCIGASVIAVALLRYVDPPRTAFMMEAWAEAKSEGDKLFSIDYRWRDIEQISPYLGLAAIASEDQKFPVHRGFDVEAIEKAYQTNANRRRIKGASTISQQTAKNLFLWPGRSYLRKGLEAYFTALEEALWPKRRILEMYLNIAEFGDGIYGAEAAAQRYFKVSASRLTAENAALLVACLPNPIRLRANTPSAYVQGRRDWILGQMRELGGTRALDAIGAYPRVRRGE